MDLTTESFRHYGIAVVFLNVLLSQAGLPVPVYPALLVAGALTASDGPMMLLVLVAAIAGAIIVDITWYAISARLGPRVLGVVCKISLSPDSCVRRAEDLFIRSGAAALILAQFIPGLGRLAVAMAAITRMSLFRFLAFDAVGAVLYVALPIGLGRLFHGAVNSFLATLIKLGMTGAMLTVGALAVYLTVRWLERLTFIRQLRMDRITVEELLALIEAGGSPVIFDVRPGELRFRDGVIPGAVPAHLSDLDTVVNSYARDLEIVIYCSCPNEASAAIAALHLKRAGFKRIRPLLGGIEAWARAGLPIEAGAAAQA